MPAKNSKKHPGRSTNVIRIRTGAILRRAYPDVRIRS